MLAFLAQRWFLLLLLLGVGTALAWPAPLALATGWLHPGVVIGIALLIMAWTMPTQSLLSELRQPWPALWAMTIGFGFLPAVGYLLGGLSSVPDLRVGLLLSASVSCTLASCVLWTRLAGGNEATALLTVFGCTLTSWFATPLWLYATTDVAVDPGWMMLDLVVILVLPVLAGQMLRGPAVGKHLATRYKTALSALAQIFVLSIVVKAAAGVGLKLQEQSESLTPETLALSASLAAGLHLLALFFGKWSSDRLGFDRARGIAVAFSGSQKTLPISLWLFEQYYRQDFPLAIIPLLFFHVGQLILDTFIAARWRR